MAVLYVCQNRARLNSASNASALSPLRKMGWRRFTVSLFWQLDIIGMALLAAALSLTLTPMSIAEGGKFHWQDMCIIAPMVAGALCIPVFIFWEYYATYPMMPFRVSLRCSLWSIEPS
jgi:SIT family siderophore-iron:H+ symporter-like MFS transporter